MLDSIFFYNENVEYFLIRVFHRLRMTCIPCLAPHSRMIQWVTKHKFSWISHMIIMVEEIWENEQLCADNNASVCLANFSSFNNYGGNPTS